MLVQITSSTQLESLLRTFKIVVVDFYADWCGPCKTIAPIYEQLATKHYSPRAFVLAKVDVDAQPDIAQAYGVRAMPTFIFFRARTPVQTIQGGDPRALNTAIAAFVADPDGAGSSSNDSAPVDTISTSTAWVGATLPRGYGDITDQVDLRKVEMLNADSSLGEARTLFATESPTGLHKGKDAATAEATQSPTSDWVESDTDEQLMLFMPFQSMLKVHSLHITSLATPGSDTTTEAPLRPRTIRLYTNHSHILDFDEAENLPATQSVELAPTDWNKSSATAVIELRFVKFQNLSSLVLFVVDAEGKGDKVRIDRIRVVGEKGERVEVRKLEKVGDGD